MEIASTAYEIPQGTSKKAVLDEITHAWPNLRQVEKEGIMPRAKIVVAARHNTVLLQRVGRGRSQFFANFPVEVSFSSELPSDRLKLRYVLRWQDFVAEIGIIVVVWCGAIWSAVREKRINDERVPIFAALFTAFILLSLCWSLYHHYRRVCSEVEALLTRMANRGAGR